MTSISAVDKKDYLFQSRVLTHVLFWLGYYLTFSLLWAKDGNYYQSFALEFVLMPIRISVAYLTMYYLIPEFLLRNRRLKFVGFLVLLLLVAAVVQRVFIYFFHELFFQSPTNAIITVAGVLRSMVLINSTVLLLSAIKMYQFWRLEHSKNQEQKGSLVEIKAEKRIHRVNSSDISYVEGLGNYVTYYIKNRKPLISYQSLKEVEKQLPDSFVRIHKSFVINKDLVDSYSNENVEIQGRVLPIGKSINLSF